MNQAAHNKLISFIWSIADDCLRDVYVRGKYRDVILPMVVLRRLDTLLEPTKDAVLEEVRFQREEMKATELDDAPLTAASGYVFYNTSKWTLKQLYATATNNQQILLANVEEYLGGFSDNVKEIIARFKLLEQMRHMANKQVLLDVLEKFISPYINLTPDDAEDPDGNMMPGLSNLGMGYVFEELIRKFNEENNEEAGEHFTPREVIHLMTHLIFDPISDRLPPVMTIYDPACGSGGMLTEAQNYIKEPDGPIAAKGDVYLYGKEINDETYAICKSDMMIKGNNPENIKVGSTLSTDEFSGNRFDFMLSNPPYGKSWSSELKHIKEGKDVIDPRFQVDLANYWGKVETVDATPRSSDGQARRGRVQLIDANLMFRKLRKNLGDKNCEFAPEHIEEILAAYTGFEPIERQLDANGDPTGIAVQIFDNADFGYHKVTIERPDRRRAQFSAERLEPLRFDKSLREPMEHLWTEHGEEVYEPGFLKGHAKAIQAWCEEREIALNAKQRAKLVDTSLWLRNRDLIGVGHQLMEAIGTEETADFNVFRDRVAKVLKTRKIKLSATEKNAILNAVSWYAEDAEKVIGKTQRFTKSELEEEAARLGCQIGELGDFGLYAQPDGSYRTYESNTDLRDSEAVPLKDSIHRYFRAEVQPHVPEAWINLDTVKIGYEISFNKYFYRHKPLRALEEVTQDILALEEKADGLIADILGVKMATKLEPAE